VFCVHVVEASHRSPRPNKDVDAAMPTTSGEEELQLQLALAMSKEEHEEEMKRQKADELKLQLAIEESKKSANVGPSYSQVLALFSVLYSACYHVLCSCSSIAVMLGIHARLKSTVSCSFSRG